MSKFELEVVSLEKSQDLVSNPVPTRRASDLVPAEVHHFLSLKSPVGTVFKVEVPEALYTEVSKVLGT